jgi:7-alpha-hydroxysteroid dehydrogenase
MAVLDQFGLGGQVAVVTGAGKGIGRGIAICLAEAGADVAVAARNEAEIEEVASAIRALGRRAIAVITDVTKEGALERLAERTAAELGSPTIWVNNAGGIPDATARYLTGVDDGAWDAQLDLNLKAVWAGSKVAAACMRESSGSIINISSRTAFGPQMKNGPYAAAKAAVNSLTETLAVELAPKIRVNAIAPGPIPTQNFIECTKVDPSQLATMEKALPVPLKRFGTPEDIGAAVVFMASPAASWVTGQCLYVTGGM